MKNVDFRNGRPLVMMVSQYDFGYSLQVALWSNGTPVTITAAEIVSENFTVACTFSGNVVTIPVTTSMTERFGHFPAELRVTDSTGQVSSKNFDFFVERSPLAVKSTQTYSGDIVEFTAKRVPLSSVVVTMEPIQSGSGDPSPTNVRPITGRTGASVVVSGKNLLDNTATTTTKQGLTYTVRDDGTVSVTGTATAASYLAIAVNETFDRDVIVNGAPSGVNGVYIQVNTPIRNVNDTGDGVTIAAGEQINAVRLRIDNGVTVNGVIFKPMIRYATESDDTYAQYNRTTYPITFTSAGTVYAGTVDLVSGRLEVTHGGYTFTGDETFGMNGGNTNIIYFNGNSLANPMKIGTWNDDENTLCSSFEKVMSNADFGIRFGANSKYIYFYQILNMLGIASIADWKTWLASNNVQITYPLETPLTYNLTPTQVMSLLGENVVWSPDGEVEVVVPEFYS